MSANFHRGLSEELRMKLQLTGLRLEEIDAQYALAGWLTVDAKGKPSTGDGKKEIKSEAARWILEAVEEVLHNNLKLTREWEERNPGTKPFTEMFPEEVLRLIAEMDPDNPMEMINELKELAESELRYG